MVALFSMSGKFMSAFYFLHTHACLVKFFMQQCGFGYTLTNGHTPQPSPHFAKIFTFWELRVNKKIEESESLPRKWQTVPS